MKSKNGTITIHERFTPAGIRVLDSKKRVTLGDSVPKDLRIDSYEVLVGENGDVLLRPMIHIPARERWIFEDAPPFICFPFKICYILNTPFWRKRFLNICHHIS